MYTHELCTCLLRAWFKEVLLSKYDIWNDHFNLYTSTRFIPGTSFYSYRFLRQSFSTTFFLAIQTQAYVLITQTYVLVYTRHMFVYKHKHMYWYTQTYVLVYTRHSIIDLRVLFFLAYFSFHTRRHVHPVSFPSSLSFRSLCLYLSYSLFLYLSLPVFVSQSLLFSVRFQFLYHSLSVTHTQSISLSLFLSLLFSLILFVFLSSSFFLSFRPNRASSKTIRMLFME